jgi:isoleucyl-tRNA synthetase
VISPEEDWVAVVLDTNLTGILVLEGFARDFVRQVQVRRGRSRLQVEQRVVLGIHTQFLQLQDEVSANLEYIAEETLGDSVYLASIEQPIATNHVRIYGYVAEISLTPVPSESRRRLPL